MTKIEINNILLDDEQTKPVIEMPRYSLIIAGAGSGKTLTMVGKIKFLLENSYYKPTEILAISFTNEAVNSLKKKININTGVDVDTLTFHRLALNILKTNNIEFSVLNSNYLEYLVDEFFNTNCFNNRNLMNSFFKYNYVLFKTDNNWYKLINEQTTKETKKLIITFLNLFFGNGLNIHSWKGIFKLSNHHERYLLNIIYAIYLAYIEEKESSHKIDFNDMIVMATKEINKGNIMLPYRFILIDEFQDTSPIRFNLIKAIIKENNASLCCVGDDYQSIYHFSGCDIDLFLNYDKLLPGAVIYKLERTYRNSQELIKMAGDFINRNPLQVKKNLISDMHLTKPIKIIYYEKRKDILIKLIKKIPPTESIFILSRNNSDIKGYLNECDYELDNSNIKIKGLSDYNIKYLTIHSAKGLEADQVIILNLEDGIYGLPSKQRDEDILRFVKKNTSYPYEEERRLFYVGLTRTKRNVYLLVSKNKPSRFINEIKHFKEIEVIKD